MENKEQAACLRDRLTVGRESATAPVFDPVPGHISPGDMKNPATAPGGSRCSCD